LELLQAVTLATPHIAGYSWDGKVAGTRQILAAYCDFFQLPLPTLDLPVNLQISKPVLRVAENLSGTALLRSALQSIYDVRADDSKMRDTLLSCAGLSCAGEPVASNFDALRKQYPIRREVAAQTIENWSMLSVENKNLLRRLGFSDQ
jgi:erythronate-4-phosphate dehydrogenase